jgi:hypothetical protein
VLLIKNTLVFTSPHNQFYFKKVQAPSVEALATNAALAQVLAYSHILQRCNLPYWQQQFIEVYEHDKLIALYYTQMLGFNSTFYKTEPGKNLFKRIFNKYLNSRKYNLVLAGSFFKDNIWGIYSVGSELSQTQIAQSFLELLHFLRNDVSIAIAGLQLNAPLNNSISKAQNLLHLPDNVGMELLLQGNWKTIDDYKNSLSKKYRSRTQKLLQQLETFEQIALDEAALAKNEQHMFALYWNIAQRQPVRLGILSHSYFTVMKQQLQERFIVIGFYKERQLVGFVSYIIENAETVTVHYIGLDAANYKELYHCILLHAVIFGIKENKQTLILGRTGIEAKAMLGAVPVTQFSYYNTTGCATKYITQYFLQKYKQKTRKHLVERHPFK